MLPPDNEEPKKGASGSPRRGPRRGRAGAKKASGEATSPPESVTAGPPDVSPPEAEESAVEAAPSPIETDREEPLVLPSAGPIPEGFDRMAEDTAAPWDRTAPKQSEPVTAAVPAPPPPPARSGGRFWTALLGTLVGAAVGAGAVWYILERMPRDPDPAITAALDGQASTLATQTDRVATLEGEIAALKEAIAANDAKAAVDALRTESQERLGGLDDGVAALGGRLDQVDGQLGALGDQMGALGTRIDDGAARLADLEARPIADPETANQVLRSEVADMRQEVEQATAAARAQVETMRSDLSAAAEATQAEIAVAQQRAAELETQARERAAAAEAEAESASRAAEAEAALARLGAAVDSGEPFAEFLPALGDGVPQTLAEHADAGVPTLAELRTGFPDAARTALRASRVASTEGEPMGRVMAFFRTQTQARSLTPQEGDTPDAILSRAEASLGAGDVAGAVALLDTLPADARAAMQGWIDDAQARAEAAAAVETLSQGMN